jgi:hypothetical protein
MERAAEKGHTEIVKVLVEKGAEFDTTGAGRHGTALQRAVALGYLEMAQFLVNMEPMSTL